MTWTPENQNGFLKFININRTGIKQEFVIKYSAERKSIGKVQSLLTL